MRKRIANRPWLPVLVALSAIFVFPGILPGQTSALTDAQVQEKASSLLRQMTLDEKVAQLSQLPGFPAPEYLEVMGHRMPEEVIATLGAGSVLWVSEPKEINRLQHLAVEKSQIGRAHV